MSVNSMHGIRGAKCKCLIIVLVVVSALLSGCSRDPYRYDIPNPEKYASYICYDYHLYCLDAYKNADSALMEDELGATYKVSYRYAVGESDDEFICARAGLYAPLSFPEILILQNPEQYIDVWNDWTVKEIQLYVQDLHDDNFKRIDEEDEPARTPTSIIATTADADCLTEIKTFAAADEPQPFIPPDGYVNEILQKDRFKFYIRVSFNESANIVWDSAVTPYYSEETGDRLICIDKGNMDDLFSINAQDVSAEHLDGLASFLSDEIETFFEANYE